MTNFFPSFIHFVLSSQHSSNSLGIPCPAGKEVLISSPSRTVVHLQWPHQYSWQDKCSLVFVLLSPFARLASFYPNVHVFTMVDTHQNTLTYLEVVMQSFAMMRTCEFHLNQSPQRGSQGMHPKYV